MRTRENGLRMCAHDVRTRLHGVRTRAYFMRMCAHVVRIYAHVVRINLNRMREDALGGVRLGVVFSCVRGGLWGARGVAGVGENCC